MFYMVYDILMVKDISVNSENRRIYIDDNVVCGGCSIVVYKDINEYYKVSTFFWFSFSSNSVGAKNFAIYCLNE